MPSEKVKVYILFSYSIAKSLFSCFSLITEDHFSSVMTHKSAVCPEND